MSVYSSTYAVCSADLYGSFSGERDIIINTGYTTLIGSNLFTILNAPLYIYSINPPSGLNTSVNLNLYINGAGFTPNTNAKLSKSGYSDIVAHSYQVLTSTYMIATFNIANAPSGRRDFVIYYGESSYTKKNAFTIVDAIAAPIIYTVEPNWSFNNIDPVVDIYGENFVDGASLKVVGSNTELVVDSFTLISSTAIVNAILPIKGYPQSKWGVKIINPDGKSYTLPYVFTLLEVNDNVKIYEPVISPGGNEYVRIAYDISQAGETTIMVYDNSGVKIRTLYKGVAEKGINEVLWDGKDDNGGYVKNGIYIIEIKTPFYKRYKRVVVIR